MKYNTTVTGWGPDALAFLAQENTNFIILFDDDAPEELKELTIHHSKAPLLADPEVGDTVIFGGKVFDITAVGNEAVSTLRDMGHCTIVFDGATEPERPGCIHLKGDEPFLPEDLKEGITLEIY